MDVTPLRNAYRAFLGAAATVTESSNTQVAPAPGEWSADQILAHVALVDAATIATASEVAAGAKTTYDNRLSLDLWTIERVISRTGGSIGLRDRIRLQGEALCTLAGEVLTEAELDTRVPTLLLSGDTALVDQLVPLKDLVTGLAVDHLPKHAEQLLALLPDGDPDTAGHE